MEISEPGPSPNLTKETASALVYRLYGIKCVDIVKLNGYCDKNYHVQINSNNEKQLWPHGYVLKIINSADSKNTSVVEAQIGAELYLGRNGIKCPQPVKNLEGHYYSMESISQDGMRTSKHLVYLLTYQPGRLLKDVPFTNAMLYNIGKFVAKVDETFKGFHHPAYGPNYKTLWSLENVSQIRNSLYVAEDEDKRQLVSAVISAFETDVKPNVDTFDKGLIHNDLNEQNILMSQTNYGSWDVCALLDFGDSHRTCYVFELAINIGHMILLSSNPVDAAGHIIAGYSSVRPLQEKEFYVLKVCVCARLCQLIIFGLSAYQQDPGNEYLLSWLKSGAWDVLHLLWNIPRDELKNKWTNIIASYDV